jgi:tRNA threonylcarbamoyladenosine biosynthesis protein TsaB
MALILNIDTAVTTASVNLSQNGESLSTKMNEAARDHASWIQPAIRELLEENHFAINSVEAVAVSIGPGSYTGLRIGLSVAKGICYALDLPLITVNTLELMTMAAFRRIPRVVSGVDLICPMIDARRMEVFYAVFDKTGNQVRPPGSAILTGQFFDGFLAEKKLLFFGNGATKFSKIFSHENAIFDDSLVYNASDLRDISENKFSQKQFADLAYVEPFYVKSFYSPAI